VNTATTNATQRASKEGCGQSYKDAARK